MEYKSRASPEQSAVLSELMERHDDITRPQQGSSGTTSAPMPSATSPTASTSRGASQRRGYRASRPPAALLTKSTRRCRRLFRARTRQEHTHFERAASEFAAIENRRLQIEADREKKIHERELEKLRLESQRIGIEKNKNQILSRLADTVDKLIEILPQLRPPSLPSTDIIP